MPSGVWDSSLEGGTSGRELRPGFAEPPLPHDQGHCGLSCMGALDTLCHAPHSSLHTTLHHILGTSWLCPGDMKTREEDGVTPLLSQHLRLSPSPEGYQ